MGSRASNLKKAFFIVKGNFHIQFRLMCYRRETAKVCILLHYLHSCLGTAESALQGRNIQSRSVGLDRNQTHEVQDSVPISVILFVTSTVLISTPYVQKEALLTWFLSSTCLSFI